VASKRKGTTAGQHSFAQIPSVNTPRSVFNRSCGVKSTFDAGQLIPVFVDEALPGDTMRMEMAMFARMATPLHPIMDNLYLDTFFFAVPLRLVWENFRKFMGEQTNPADSTDFTIPIVVAPDPGGWPNESLADYFGMPTKVPGLITSALYHRCYGLIWDEWFRDENLQDSWDMPTDNGPDANNLVSIYPRGKRHDYFTSCLPFPEKGDPVTLSFGQTAPVITDDTSVSFQKAAGSTSGFLKANVATAFFDPALPVGSSELHFVNSGLKADLSLTTGTSINAIREAFQIQKLQERDARGGTRYTEIVRSHFGVVSPDARLQRPEYLGGGSVPVNISVVPQTSQGDTTAQGNLAGYGVAAGTLRGWNKSFTEHCIIMGMVSVRADLNYQQGLPKQFSRSSRFDFYWPSFAHLGEQAVLNQEIFAQGTDDTAADAATFGYQERYAEYRYKPSQITGKMRSNDAVSLDTWHLAQDFVALPLLNDAFMQDDPPIFRVSAVPSEPEFLFDAFFEYRCVRAMPTYGVPGMIDHF